MGDLVKAGALWLKDGRNGKKFMSGVFELDGAKTSVLVFKNNFKEKDGPRAPDYVIYLAEDRQADTTQPTRSAPARPVTADDPITDDDCPF